MIRRRIVFIYWICAFVFMPTAVYAYIDPATTTYLIQIVTALIVMVGVSLTVFLYRFRMITSKIKYWILGTLFRSGLLHDSRNAAAGEAQDDCTGDRGLPFVLPEYAVPDSETPPSTASFDKETCEALQESIDIRNRGRADTKASQAETYKGRIRITAPLATAFCFTFIIIGCLELSIKYAPEIPFNIPTILPAVLILFAIVLAVLLFAVPAFRGRVFEALICTGLSALIAGYLQGNFFNTGLGQLTGDRVVWSNLGPQIAVSLICWAVCFFAVFFIWKKSRKIWRGSLVFVPLLLILLQSVSFASVINDSVNQTKSAGGPLWVSAGDFWKAANETLTIDGINDVSKTKNAVIIVLDRMDQEFIDQINSETPSFFDPLDGFTEFDDYIQWYGSTFPSVPGFLTGVKYQYDMPKNDYFTYAWENAAFLQTLKARGIDIRLYMDRGFSYNYISQLQGIASNTFEGELGINKRIALIKLLKLSGYRYAPMLAKEIFWFAPTEFIDSLELTDQTYPYIIDDFRYYNSLLTDGLSAVDNAGSFKYIHLQGPHPPFNMDENTQYVEQSDFIRQTKGSMRIVYEYIRQLKELGLYDNTMIIIMGDHGNYLGDDLTRPAHTALFVKPVGSSGTPIQYSHAPVSPDQLHATVMESLFGDTGGFGKTFFDIKEGDDMVREYIINLWRYEITGDGRDFSNWKFAGLFPDTYK